MAAWLGAIAIVLFLFANVVTINAGVAYAYLGAASVCVAFILIVSADPATSITIARSTPFLLAFLAYFLLRLLLDFPDFADVRSLSIGTDGGVLFGLALGTAASLFAGAIAKREARLLPTTATLAFLLLCLVLAAHAYTAHIHSLRSNVFLVADNRGNYQRPGNFVILIGLLASVVLAQASLGRRGKGFVLRALTRASVLVYLALTAVLVVTAQLIGSNTGTVVTAFVAIGTLAWLFRPALRALRWRSLRSLRAVDSISAFRKALPRLVVNGLVFLGAGLVCGLGVLIYLHLGTEQLRLFGFSDRDIWHSLIGRLQVDRQNFATQFAYSPIFGDMKVDELTTGGGSYAHSLISLLSHTGLVGTTLFAAYLAAAYRDFRRAPRGGAPFHGNADVGMLRLILAIMMLVYATIGTFFTWLPLWFSFGLLSPPIVLSQRQRRLAPVAGASAPTT